MSAVPNRLVLQDCKLADGTEVDIRLENGRIHSFSSRPADGAPVIDLAGRLVLPALIDAHIHLDPFELPDQVPRIDTGRLRSKNT